MMKQGSIEQPHTSPEGLSEKTGRMADTAERIVYNCTGKIEHDWQRKLIERIRVALGHPPVPIGEEMVQRKPQIEESRTPESVPLSPTSKGI